jgi:hypothetical protein
LGTYDVALILAVSIQSTALACVGNLRWKGFILLLPIPLTFGVMAVGQRIDTTNVVGLILLLGFAHGLRVLYQRCRVPIVAATALAALGYCAAGWLLADVLPTADWAYWSSIGAALAIGGAGLFLFDYPPEPDYRSPVPFWIKLPCIMAIVVALITIKHELKGFTTVFPMVTSIAAYEMRHSMWTFCRQVAFFMLTGSAMMTVSRVTQPAAGMELSLLFGWFAMLSTFFLLNRMAPRARADGETRVPQQARVLNGSPES